MKVSNLILYLLITIPFTGFTQFDASKAQAELETLIRNKKVVGVAAGFAIDSSIIWSSTAGFANKEENKPLETPTALRTASIAKSMTAVAIMQLVEKGLIDLDKPIESYIPEFVQNHSTKITTRHLLSHTSGIGAYKNRKEAESVTYFNNLNDAYMVFKDRKLEFEPGTQYYYTTYGYVVLGMLIENVSGSSYEEYMQNHIWDRAGMKATGVEKRLSLPKNYTQLYSIAKGNKLELARPNDLSNRIPGGGLYSTVPDLLRFGLALINGELITNESLDLMTQHHSLDKYNNGYGFGFYLYGKPDVNDIYGHNGAQTGASSQLFIVPSLKLVTVAMSNTSGTGQDISGLAAKLIDLSQKE